MYLEAVPNHTQSDRIGLSMEMDDLILLNLNCALNLEMDRSR